MNLGRWSHSLRPSARYSRSAMGESNVRYLGIEADDALELAEQTDV
jgi:hypothetical protein